MNNNGTLCKCLLLKDIFISVSYFCMQEPWINIALMLIKLHFASKDGDKLSHKTSWSLLYHTNKVFSLIRTLALPLGGLFNTKVTDSSDSANQRKITQEFLTNDFLWANMSFFAPHWAINFAADTSTLPPGVLSHKTEAFLFKLSS